MDEQAQIRFWSKVDKRGPDECWGWTGSLHAFGYGLFSTGSKEKHTRKVRTAHRLSWQFAHGPITSAQHVLHRCDNPPCVNPAHLFLGDQAANVRDMDAKGRRVTVTKRGVENARARLSESDVLEIRKRLASGETHRSLATRFSISQCCIWGISNGTLWSHI